MSSQSGKYGSVKIGGSPVAAPAPEKETPAAKHPFQDANVINAFASGVKNTLSEMAQMNCDFERPFVEKEWTPTADATGVMELKSNQHTGYLHIHFPKEAICEIMSKMLGEPTNEFNDEVLDGVGEITNIVYGTMKAKLNPLGYEFKMATPKADYTKNLPDSNGPGNKHLIIPFKVSGIDCAIEIVLMAVH